jgi:hypothetical protein
MADSIVADAMEAQIALIALTRHVSDRGIDVNAAKILLDGIDPILTVIVAARMLHNALTDLAHFAQVPFDELLDTLATVAIDQAADQ